MSAFIYLAQPIDVSDANPIVIEGARKRLAQADLWVFDPALAFQCAGAAPDPRLQIVSNVALDQCDAVLALLPKTAKSVGVPVEIARAAALGKPVFVWRDTPSWFLISLPTVQAFDLLSETIDAMLGFLAREAAFKVHPAYSAAPALPVYTGTGQAPRRAHGDDAGFDLFASEGVTIYVRACAKVLSHVSVQWPVGYWGLLIGRSSTAEQDLMVIPTVIDPGFRGELFVMVRNLGNSPVRVERGQRIAQVVPLPAPSPYWGLEMQRVDQLSETTRGSNGLGSSGR